MLLRNGKIYYTPINISNLVLIQAFIRGEIDRRKYMKILAAIQLIKKDAPHLYRYKPKVKKKSLNVNNKLTRENNDINEIILQYNTLKHLGRNNNFKSSRRNKGKAPDRYIDDSFLDIFIESDDDIDAVFDSDSEYDKLSNE